MTPSLFLQIMGAFIALIAVVAGVALWALMGLGELLFATAQWGWRKVTR